MKKRTTLVAGAIVIAIALGVAFWHGATTNPEIEVRGPELTTQLSSDGQASSIAAGPRQDDDSWLNDPNTMALLAIGIAIGTALAVLVKWYVLDREGPTVRNRLERSIGQVRQRRAQ